MWGKIEAGNIIQLYNYPVNLTDAQGTVYPKSYFQDNTKLAEFSVYPVTMVNNPPSNTELYWDGGINHAWNSDDSVIEGTYSYIAKNINDVNEVWTQSEIDDGQAPSGTSANDPKLDEDGNQIVTLGLKSTIIAHIKSQQAFLLSETDKWIVRKVEKDIDVPTTVTTYRDNIRTASDTMITAVNDASTFDAVKLLFNNATYNDDGSLNTPSTLYNFPSVPQGMPK